MISLCAGYNITFKQNSNHNMKDLSEFNIDKAVMVHMTDYLPVNGEILSTKNAYKDKKGLRKPRNTVHFAFNHVVTPNSIGLNWNNKPIGIIVPFADALKINPKENIIGGEPRDFYIKNKVKLPAGTVIVRKSKKIPQGKYRVINAETINAMRNTKGIKIIETSDNVKDITNQCIEKMGYTRLDKLYRQETGFIDNTHLSSKDIKRIINADNKINLAWNKMANNIGFTIYKNHQTSPYGRSEFLIDSVDILARYHNKWNSKIEVYNIFSQKDELININYKDMFLNVINDIQKSIPKDKTLSYDIQGFKENIITSKTPKDALEKLEKEQGLKPMGEDIGKIRKNSSPNTVYRVINNLLDLFSV